MKFINNILALAAMLMAAASCAIVSDDAFSTAPAAPVMTSHADILITTETVDEAVTFAWEKARFIDAEEYEYALYVAYSGKEVILAEHITDLYYTLSKSDFRSFLMTNFDLPQNSTHAISVYASITDDSGERYDAAALAINVYVYDDAVPAEVTAGIESIVLDSDKPSESIAILNWTSARLAYGEDVTYTIKIRIGENKEYVVASGLSSESYSITVDDLNTAVIAAGATIDEATEVSFTVYACSESLPDGVPSNTVKITVTAYNVEYPETLWIPGEGSAALNWNFNDVPTLSQSAKEKGVYRGFVDLTPTDPDTDIQFKFSPVADWKDSDFAFGNVKVTPAENGNYNCVSASGIAGGNIVCPGGVYYIEVNIKYNTLQMVEIESFVIVGDFDWNDGVTMTWNAESKTWTTDEPVEIDENSEFKFRLTNDWNYSFGGSMEDPIFNTSDNMLFTGETGSYNFILDASSSDFNVKATLAE